MTELQIEEPRTDGAASGRGWGVSLAATVLACLVAAFAAISTDGQSWTVVALTAVISGVYSLVFVLLRRGATGDSLAGWGLLVATIVSAGVLTAVVPSNALLQFWAYPLIWTLQPRTVRALVMTFLLALSVFAGFAVSTGDESDWPVTALLTQGVSFVFNVVMGLWITSVWRYAATRDRLIGELTAAQDELAVLHRDAGTTSERERLSRELHDTLAQSLAAVVLLVQRSRRELAAGALDDEALEIVEESARTALAETRALVAGSAPIELHDGGIERALETLAERFRRETGLVVDVDVSLEMPLSREVDVALLRCAQEGLGNIRKHSDARRVEISLTGEADAAVLRVRNDGRGFDPAGESRGFGLKGLRDRLDLIGGTLVVDGSEGAVTVVARIPRGVGA
ncbi:sensor histidine kinase [Microbacterium sp. P06]|uniref:sensor histidine kinase n=1 Tax=Microbacterium sp. P06 TaxID=3366949 RepID=UPI00374538CD